MERMIRWLLIFLAVLFVNARDLATAQNTKQPLQHTTDSFVNYTLYITFDDGPLEGSEDINDAVKSEDIKVNVFVVGQNALSNQRMKRFYELYQNNPFIEIGNHSFSHAHDQYKEFYDNPANVLQDFLKNQQDLQIKNKLARLPGRNMWRLKDTSINDVSSGKVAADLLYQNGFRVFGWDIEWQHDPKTKVPIQTVTDVMEMIEMRLRENKTVRKGHLVLLAHDEMFRKGWEESELKELIRQLKMRRNYHFEHLSNYPQ